jgi:hypothetical protein
MERRLLRKRCRILPARGPGCPPDLKVPQDWGIRGLIQTISAFSKILQQEQ